MQMSTRCLLRGRSMRGDVVHDLCVLRASGPMRCAGGSYLWLTPRRIDRLCGTRSTGAMHWRIISHASPASTFQALDRPP